MAAGGAVVNNIGHGRPEVATQLLASNADVNQALPSESPLLDGLPPDAEIGFLTSTSEKLFRTVFELQPREGGGGGGQAATREEQVKTQVDDIMEKHEDIEVNCEFCGKRYNQTLWGAGRPSRALARCAAPCGWGPPGI